MNARTGPKAGPQDLAAQRNQTKNSTGLTHKGPCVACRRSGVLNRAELCRRCWSRNCTFLPAPAERES